MKDPEVKIALFDFDGTLVSSHLWSGLLKYYFKKRERLFSIFWFLISNLALTPFWKTGLISTKKYYQSWGEDMARLMKGVDISRAKEIFDWLTDDYLLPTLKKNTFEKLKKHQEDGYLIVLTSGSFQDLIKIFSSRLNIDFAVGTELEIVKNKFSGRIIPPLCFAQGKAEKVKQFLTDNNLAIDFKESFAYSDSIFDLPILELVGNPVAVEPDKELLKTASTRGWRII
jgi:HAD superfamily hydrolase (TIGR01490 family)